MSDTSDRLVDKQVDSLSVTNIELETLKLRLALLESQGSQSNNENEVDLKELWNVIWQGKWTIIVITILFTFASVFYALSLPNIYKSEALLMANNQEQNGGGLGALAGQYGGLASLAGINLGGSSLDKTGYALEVMKSRRFLYEFIREHNLKPVISAAIGWNKEKNEIIYEQNLYDSEVKLWSKNSKATKEPSLQESYESLLNDIILIYQDPESSLVRIMASHYSPHVSEYIVSNLVNKINKEIKEQDMSEASKSIKYFQEELTQTSVTDAKKMFYQLIEQQQQTLMLTKIRDDYVFKLVDSAVVAEKKVGPKRSLICVLGSLVGMFIGCAIALFRHYVRDV